MRSQEKNWKEIRNNFLTYTRAERNGIIVLVGLIILVNMWNLYDRFYRIETHNYSQGIAEIEEAYKSSLSPIKQTPQMFKFDPNEVSEKEMILLGFEKRAVQTFIKYRATGVKFESIEDFAKVYSIDSNDVARVKDYIFFGEKNSSTKITKRKTAFVKKKVSPTTLFDFDPNTVSDTELLQLGLPNRVVKTIFRFRSKGAFRKADDLGKIYGLDENQFQQLLPYIKIAPKRNEDLNTHKSKIDSSLNRKIASTKIWEKEERKLAPNSIDINSASIEEWQRINGVGPTFASMIVNYRNKLGGFYDVNQIGETYGIPDSVFQKIIPFVKTSSPKSKILINKITIDSLARHPYISWKESRVIYNYRSKHGAFKTSKDVLKCRIFDEEEWGKILPYFDYQSSIDSFKNEVR